MMVMEKKKKDKYEEKSYKVTYNLSSKYHFFFKCTIGTVLYSKNGILFYTHSLNHIYGKLYKILYDTRYGMVWMV